MIDPDGKFLCTEFETTFKIEGLGEVYIDEEDLAVKIPGGPVLKRKWWEVFEWMEGK